MEFLTEMEVRFLMSAADELRPRLGRLPHFETFTCQNVTPPHPSCKHDQIKMRDYMERRVTPPTWGPPRPCKQALHETRDPRRKPALRCRTDPVSFIKVNSSRISFKRDSLRPQLRFSIIILPQFAADQFEWIVLEARG